MKYLFLFLLLPLTSQAQDTARLKTPLFDNWSFQKGTRPDPRKWDAVHPPHTWNKFDLSDDEPGYYRGPAWYRCILNWDNLPQKERAFIYFEAAFQHAEVWVNGKQAGSHKGGYTAFCLDITELVSRQSDTILVRLDNSPDPLIPPLKGGVNFYGGLFRDVWLLQTSGVHIDLLDHGGPGVYITTPEIDIERGTVEIRGTLVNHNGHTTRKRLRAHILDASGKEMVGTQKGINIPPGQTAFRLNLAVNHPHLWSTDDPYLYTVKIQVISGDAYILEDELDQPLAFRWFSFSPRYGFALNSIPLKLKGISLAQDDAHLGNALDNATLYHRVQQIKDLGVNFLRIAHSPPDPVVLEACDRYGLVVSMDLPLNRDLTNDPAFFENTKTMLREMIRQHFNHPAVMIWTYMNDMLAGRHWPQDSADIKRITAFARELNHFIRTEDPTRPTMITNHTDVEVCRESGISGIPTILGWNLQDSGETSGADGFARFLDQARQEWPDKPMMVSDWGIEADPSLRSVLSAPAVFSQEWQTSMLREHLGALSARPWLAGNVAGSLRDFGTEGRGGSAPPVKYSGLISLRGEPKDACYLYKTWLSKAPVVYIGSRSWTTRAAVQNREDGSCMQSVRVFGNVDSVILFHNGKSLGTRLLTDYIAEWEVPFSDSKDGQHVLTAVAARKGVDASDRCIIDFSCLPSNSLFTQKRIGMNLGSEQYYVEPDGQATWIPEVMAGESRWGITGGQPYMPRDMPTGTDQPIPETQLSPPFQSQCIGLKTIYLPLAPGRHTIHLFFAELEYETPGKRVFSVKANNQIELEHLDLAAEAGRYRPAGKTIEVYLTTPGLTLEFVPEKGQAVLNALQVISE